MNSFVFLRSNPFGRCEYNPLSIISTLYFFNTNNIPGAAAEANKMVQVSPEKRQLWQVFDCILFKFFLTG